jgi:hypothetical protein
MNQTRRGKGSKPGQWREDATQTGTGLVRLGGKMFTIREIEKEIEIDIEGATAGGGALRDGVQGVAVTHLLLQVAVAIRFVTYHVGRSTLSLLETQILTRRRRRTDDAG